MKGGIIYEPKGRALEYSPLAANLYTGCPHGCTYCYAPGALHMTREKHRTDVRPRDNVLARLEHDCKRLQGDPRPVLLCFTCDPYPMGIDTTTTREALEIMAKYEIKAQVLTKGGVAACRDFDLLKANEWKFGSTISFCRDHMQPIHEPHASPLYLRRNAIRSAKEIGIYTWVSVEPVIDPEEAILSIETMLYSVDFWMIGKLNHDAKLEASIDWGRFLRDVRCLMNGADKVEGRDYYIKTDLLGYDK